MRINKNIIIAAFFLFFAFATVFVFCPLIANIKKIALAIGDQKALVAAYDRRVEAARGFSDFAKEEKPGMDSVAAAFADIAMPLDLINALESAAAGTGVDIEFLPLAQDPSFMRIEMNLSGDSLGVWRFIEKMENSPYLSEVESVSVSLSASLASRLLKENNVIARVLLKIYAKP